MLRCTGNELVTCIWRRGTHALLSMCSVICCSVQDMLKFELQDVETLKIRFFSTVAFPALDPIGAVCCCARGFK